MYQYAYNNKNKSISTIKTRSYVLNFPDNICVYYPRSSRVWNILYSCQTIFFTINISIISKISYKGPNTSKNKRLLKKN